MLRALAKDSLAYGVAAVVGRFAGFITLPVYARVLTQDDIGAIDLLMLAIGLVQVTVALEIAQGMARHHADREPGPERARLLSTALGFALAAYSAFAIVGFLAAGALSDALLGGRYRDAVHVGVASAWVAGVLQLVLNQLRYQVRPRAYVGVNLVFVFSTALLSVGFILGPHWGAAGVMAGQVVGGALALGTAIALAGGIPRPGLHLDDLKQMLRFSVPLVPSSVGVIVLVSVDRVVISQAMTLGDVGLFGVGYRIAQITSIVFVALQLALAPLIYQRHRDPGTPHQLARIFRLFAAGTLVFWVALAAFAPLVIGVLATDQYLGAAPLVPLLAGALVLSAAQVFAPGLSLAMQTSRIAIINIAGGALNTILNVTLVPRFGLFAAAGSTLASAAVVFGLTVWLGQRGYAIPFEWPRIGAALTIGTAVVVAIQAVPGWTPIDVVMRVAGVLGTVVACLAFGLVRRADLPAFGLGGAQRGPT